MANLLTPMSVLHFAVLLALLRCWWKEKQFRRRLRWVVIPFAILTTLDMAPASYLALRSLEWRFPPSSGMPADAEAIVVLSGLVLPVDEVRQKAELGPNTLTRCLHAATLHQMAPHLPILVSGGQAAEEGAPIAAEKMSEFLVGHGVKQSIIIEEKRSQNTYENAVESCRILRERGIRRIVLVTTASHMQRAAACFRKQGMEVIPSPCGHIANQYYFGWEDLVPSAKSALHVDEAWHEWLGMAIYRMRGRI